MVIYLYGFIMSILLNAVMGFYISPCKSWYALKYQRYQTVSIQALAGLFWPMQVIFVTISLTMVAVNIAINGGGSGLSQYLSEARRIDREWYEATFRSF